MSESSIVNTKNKSYSVTAELVVPTSGAEGVIIALGGIIGGWSLYTKNGKLKYCYNFYGLDRYTIESTQPIPQGTHQVRMEFAYDGGGLAKGGMVTLFVDGKKSGEGRVDDIEPMIFSADETCDVGNDFGSPVTYDYPEEKKFDGEVSWVEIDIGKVQCEPRAPYYLARRSPEPGHGTPVGTMGRQLKSGCRLNGIGFVLTVDHRVDKSG